MTVTVNLPEDLAARLAAEATRRGITVDAVLAEMVADRLPARRRLSFIGIGDSGGAESVAEDHQEVIRDHFADKTASDVWAAAAVIPGRHRRPVRWHRQRRPPTRRMRVVDASIVAVAERLEVPTVATLDRRHFSVMRPAHCHAFELLP